jgi:hypothetical protein
MYFLQVSIILEGQKQQEKGWVFHLYMRKERKALSPVKVCVFPLETKSVKTGNVIVERQMGGVGRWGWGRGIIQEVQVGDLSLSFESVII